MFQYRLTQNTELIVSLLEQIIVLLKSLISSILRKYKDKWTMDKVQNSARFARTQTFCNQTFVPLRA